MYSILFVDDEQLIIDSVQYLLEWQKNGFALPLTARSVSAAKGIFLQEKVDVLICDLELLNESGFSLIEWVRGRYPQTLIAISTCHAEFEYAQRAVRLGVVEYLLKPLVREEFEGFLANCRRRLASISINIELGEQERNTSDMIHTVLEYIDANLQNDLTRENICKAVFISETYLSKLFRKETGVSISEYIVERRIALAKRLLAETNEPISTICVKTGYNFPAHFSKIFRLRTGKTPMQYRAEQRDAGHGVKGDL